MVEFKDIAQTFLIGSSMYSTAGAMADFEAGKPASGTHSLLYASSALVGTLGLPSAIEPALPGGASVSPEKSQQTSDALMAHANVLLGLQQAKKFSGTAATIEHMNNSTDWTKYVLGAFAALDIKEHIETLPANLGNLTGIASLPKLIASNLKLNGK